MTKVESFRTRRKFVLTKRRGTGETKQTNNENNGHQLKSYRREETVLDALRQKKNCCEFMSSESGHTAKSYVRLTKFERKYCCDKQLFFSILSTYTICIAFSALYIIYQFSLGCTSKPYRSRNVWKRYTWAYGKCEAIKMRNLCYSLSISHSLLDFFRSIKPRGTFITGQDILSPTMIKVRWKIMVRAIWPHVMCEH